MKWSVRRRFVAGLSALALAVPLASAATGTVSAAPASAGAGEPQQAAAAAAAAAAAEEASPDLRAAATGRQTGRAQELESMRTENAEVFANPDGSKTMRQHATPVRVRKGTGWVAPDPTLRRQSDGSVQPGATVTPVVLSGGGTGDLLTVGKPGSRVHLGWLGPLPKPVLDGDTATYPEVLPGIDLKVRVGVDRFSHLLVVKNRTAAANPALRTLRYPLRAEGVGLSVGKDGSTVATGKDGKVLYRADPPTMWDSSSTTKPRLAKLGIQKTARDLVLTPNLGLLNDPAAKFPLLIDPS